MHASTLLSDAKAATRLVRATVAAVHDDGTVTVAGEDRDALRCDVLATSEAASLELSGGDTVLVWDPGAAEARGVVLGRVGPGKTANPQDGRDRASAAGSPEELVLEATKSLTLRVGDGSITLREDGRIVIKGTDLVSHAKRQNRIRGGSVAIN